jgi:hypothetical protein
VLDQKAGCILSEHLSSQQIERYGARTMPSTELLEASDHLAACGSCRRLVGEAEHIQSRYESMRGALTSEAHSIPAHLAYEQLEAYVDGASDEVESEIIESHLVVCSRCDAEAQDLRVLKIERSSYSQNKSAEPARLTLRQFFNRVWQQPWYALALEFACGAAAILIAAWAVTLPLRNQVTELRTRLAEAQQKNDELQGQVAGVDELQAKLRDLQQSALGSSAPLDRALYDAGRIIVLDRQGEVSGIESTSIRIRQDIKSALINDHREQSPELRGLLGRAGVLLGGSSQGVSFALITPVGTAVESDRPTFRWKALPGATGYTVNVYDQKLQSVAASDPVSSLEWTPPHALKRGEVYTWQVTATKAGEEITSPTPPAPEAKFKVLEQSRVEEITQIKRSNPESHLALGAVYKGAGLLDDAEREFKALLTANPHSAVAQKLLDNVKSLRQK